MANYGSPCNRDKDCSSKICEMTYINGTPDTRRCLLQQEKYGEQCFYNKDCDSHRCVTVFDDNGYPLGQRCRIIEGQIIPERPSLVGDNPDLSSEENEQNRIARESEYIIGQKQKNILLEGTGPVTDIIVLLMEIPIVIIKEIIRFIFSLWKMIFFLVQFPFSWIYDQGIFGFSDKYETADKQCNSKSYTITSKIFVKIIALLFPPFAVFLDRGILGIGHIIICSILSIMFYLPGVIYAFMIIDDAICPNSIILFSDRNYNKGRNQFSYGDYNMRDIRLQELGEGVETRSRFEKSKKSYDKYGTEAGWFGEKDEDVEVEKYIPDMDALIGSIKVGKNVKVILYEKNDFTNEIGIIEYDTPELYKKLSEQNIGKENIKYIKKGGSYFSGFSEKQGESVKVRSISIRLMIEPEIIPKTIDENSIICYLLNNFKGQHLILQEGHYDSNELSKLFNNRISSIRIGKKMRIKLFQNKHYNRKSTFSIGDNISWVSTGGLEKEFNGTTPYNITYNTKGNPGEISNLSFYNFNDIISSMSVCNIDNTKCLIDPSENESRSLRDDTSDLISSIK